MPSEQVYALSLGARQDSSSRGLESTLEGPPPPPMELMPDELRDGFKGPFDGQVRGQAYQSMDGWVPVYHQLGGVRNPTDDTHELGEGDLSSARHASASDRQR